MLGFLLQLSHLGLHLLGLVFLSFFHQSADLTGKLLLLIQALVEFLLSLATLLVYGQYFVDGLLCIGKMLLLQATNHTFSLLTDEFEC